MAQHEFVIIADFEEDRWYSEYTPERYDCVAVHDDVISSLVRDYMDDMMRIETYFQVMTQPGHGLDEYGVTLIPPRSLEAFYQVVSMANVQYESVKLHLLLEKIHQAIREGRYLIRLCI